jgi:hypothetical protein
MLGLNPRLLCIKALGISVYESVVEAVIVKEEAVRLLKEVIEWP